MLWKPFVLRKMKPVSNTRFCQGRHRPPLAFPVIAPEKGFSMKRTWSWCRLSAAMLSIVLLLSGCSHTTPTLSQTNPFDARVFANNVTINQLPSAGRGYSIQLVRADAPEADAGCSYVSPDSCTSITYTGEPVLIDFVLLNDNPECNKEMGLSLYVNGVPQPFSVRAREGISPTETDVLEYRWDVYGSETYRLPLAFTPVCGRQGDTLTLFCMLTSSPSYHVTTEKEAGSGWMKSISPFSYTLHMEADAPTQTTVDTCLWDNGVSFEFEDGIFLSTNSEVSERRRQNAIAAQVNDELAKEYISANLVRIVRPEEDDRHMEVILTGCTQCTPRFRVQLRLNGQPAPVFNGKYYADVVFPNTQSQLGELLSVPIDLKAYADKVRTIQFLMIPLPENAMEFSEANLHLVCITSTSVSWVRYSDEAGDVIDEM